MTASPAPARVWAAVILGVCATAGIYLVAFPWDLSTVDANGSLLHPTSEFSGGEAHTGADWLELGAGVALVALLVQVVARPRPAHLTWIGPLLAWAPAGIFAMRAASARVIGANLWPISALMMFAWCLVAALIGLGIALGGSRIRAGRHTSRVMS